MHISSRRRCWKLRATIKGPDSQRVAIFKRRAQDAWWRSRHRARTTEGACSCQWCYYYIQMREVELKYKSCPQRFLSVAGLKNKLFFVIFLAEVYKLHRKLLKVWLSNLHMHTDLLNRKAHRKQWWSSHKNSRCISPHTCHRYGNTSQNWCSDPNNQVLHQEWLLPSLLSQGSHRSSSESGCIRENLSDLPLHLDEKWRQRLVNITLNKSISGTTKWLNP